jgi:uncharacterized membrane protein YphA (DoxX/SURF4 family)
MKISRLGCLHRVSENPGKLKTRLIAVVPHPRDAKALPGVEEGVIMVDRRLIAACWVVRLALAASFLSAVADRLGLWGPPGATGVSWGSVPKYEEYVAQLNWFLPAGLVPVAGWAATACEVTLATGLLIGWRLRWVAFAAGILLTVFAVTMAVALGPKSPLDYSVPSAAGAAFLLAALTCATSPRTGLGFAAPARARPHEDVDIDVSRESPI